MSSPFDFINSINEKTGLPYDTSYNAFMVNRGLSNHIQTVFYANEMNKSSHIDSELQYDFYIHGIPKAKRFGKWHKKVDDKNINIIMERYQIGRQRAIEYLSILSEEQIKVIAESLYKGGK